MHLRLFAANPPAKPNTAANSVDATVANIMPQAHSTKSLVILSAEADSAAVSELGKRLTLLESSGQLRIWDGGDLPPGANCEAVCYPSGLTGCRHGRFLGQPMICGSNDAEFDFVCNTAGLRYRATTQGVKIMARHANLR
jgi:hypothetical protein